VNVDESCIYCERIIQLFLNGILSRMAQFHPEFCWLDLQIQEKLYGAQFFFLMMLCGIHFGRLECFLFISTSCHVRPKEVL